MLPAPAPAAPPPMLDLDTLRTGGKRGVARALASVSYTHLTLPTNREV